MIENKLIIEMVSLPDFKPQKTGKYLVRTVSTHSDNVNIFIARVGIYGDRYSIDVNNQTVTHVSKLTLE
jgi:hypothetical protein